MLPRYGSARAAATLVAAVTALWWFSCLSACNAKVLNRALTKILTVRDASTNQLQPFASALEHINAAKRNPLFSMDQRSYSSIMTLCVEQKLGLDGLRFYKEMVSGGADIKPDRITYGLAMTCCVLSCDSVQANSLLAECDSRFLLGSSIKYREQELVLLGMCLAANAMVNEWAQIKAHFAMLTRTRGMQPTANILESMLRACKNTEDEVKWAEVEGYLAVLGRVDFASQQQPQESGEVAVVLLTEKLQLKTLAQCLALVKAAASPEDLGAAIARVSGASTGDSGTRAELVNALEVTLGSRRLVHDAVLRRRVKRLLDKLNEVGGRERTAQSGPAASGADRSSISQSSMHLVAPTVPLYAILIRHAGRLADCPLAFRYYNDLLSKGLEPSRMVLRELVEAASRSGDALGTERARQLLLDRFGSLRLVALGVVDEAQDVTKLRAPPSASFTPHYESIPVNLNNLPGPASAAVRKLAALAKHTFIFSSLPQQGTSIASDETKRELLLHHCEKQALALMLASTARRLPNETTTAITTQQGFFYPHISVSPCMCADCHAFFRATSRLLKNEITCRDPKRVHIFLDGTCSCNDLDY